jgi:CopG family transcriptional regulator, nickel-responsive regulator
MQRVTITLDDELMTELDRIIAARGYQNRSEAIRDLARAGIRQEAATLGEQGDCVAALVYVYDHNARQLSKRLADTFHDHHEMSPTTRCRWPRCMRISTTTAAWR